MWLLAIGNLPVLRLSCIQNVWPLDAWKDVYPFLVVCFHCNSGLGMFWGSWYRTLHGLSAVTYYFSKWVSQQDHFVTSRQCKKVTLSGTWWCRTVWWSFVQTKRTYPQSCCVFFLFFLFLVIWRCRSWWMNTSPLPCRPSATPIIAPPPVSSATSPFYWLRLRFYRSPATFPQFTERLKCQAEIKRPRKVTTRVL